MGCCGKVRPTLVVLGALVAALSSHAQAQVHAQSAVAVPSGFPDRVGAVVAARWGVDASAVRVELTSERTAWPDEDARFRVQSAAADGTFVLAFEGDATRPLVVRAGMLASAPVAARDLARGETLTESAIAYEPTILWGPPKQPEPSASAGWQVRRRVAQGEPLRTPAVAPPLAVRAGDEVRIVLIRGGITVALSGRAAGQAGMGERVAVRADTGRRLEGVATAPGVVTIDAPGREQP